MAHLLTDVTSVLTRSFPTGKPEMSASAFDRANKFVIGRRNGSVPRPGKLSMDYGWWAQCMVLEWRLTVADWETAGRVGPEPAFLICPECDVMLLLDNMSNDVLMCPGGCHRAITVNAFVGLFQPAPYVRKQAGYNPPRSYTTGQPNNLSGMIRQLPQSPGKASLSSTVPQGARPEDYGITEGVQKSRKPLVGWRMWQWEYDDARKPRLTSLHIAKQSSWLPMVPQRGTCSGEDPKDITDHACPSWEHRCGVHAVKEIGQLRKWGITSGKRVAGQVEMWGRVLEYEEGYRAEWAYPIKLYLPSVYADIADGLWEAYLTEVVVDDDIFDQIKNS